MMFLILVVITTMSYAQDMGSYIASQKIGDKYENVELNALYDKKYDQIYLHVDGTNRSTFLTVGTVERYEFMFAFITFNKWCYKCDSAKIFTSKTIETWDIGGGFYYGSEIHLFKNSPVEFGILTGQNTDGSTSCSFYISLPKLVASDNKYMEIPARTIYVSSSEAEKLKYLVSEDAVKKQKENKAKIDEILK